MYTTKFRLAALGFATHINISPYSVEKHFDEPISPDMEVSPASDLISAAETSTQVILSNTPVGLYS